jgi:hypothetical protein
MRGAIPPFPNMSSWRDDSSRGLQGCDTVHGLLKRWYPVTTLHDNTSQKATTRVIFLLSMEILPFNGKCSISVGWNFSLWAHETSISCAKK